MALRLKTMFGLAVPILLAAAPQGRVLADPLPQPSLEVPIDQTVMQDGTIRYSIWLKVGDRFVEAMLDTGSTGLRVLPPVVPGDLMGLPLEAAYGSGVDLKGLAVVKPVEIGPLTAPVPIEVVDHFGCTSLQPDCPVKGRGGDYLIAGDGASSHGFSAILGIGFTSRSNDIPNPLEVLGAAQWVIDLPRPDDATPGKLVLKPDAALRSSFKMLPSVKGGDVSGCLISKPLEQQICGPMLLDTGAVGVIAVTEDQKEPILWATGTPVILRFPGGLKLPFDATDKKMQQSVAILPTKDLPRPVFPFMLLGPYAFHVYDVLYDATAHKVGLKTREPAPEAKL